MNTIGYVHSLVNIYWWKYYDLLTKSVDSTDRDHIFKKSNFVSFTFHTSAIHSHPIWITPSSNHSPSSSIHSMFSPQLRLEPSTLRCWTWRANHYNTPPVKKSDLKLILIKVFSSIIDLLKNYRIIQYFSLIIFMVLAKLSPCFLEISNMLQEHERSVSFTNSVSKFYKYFKVPVNCKKFQ